MTDISRLDETLARDQTSQPVHWGVLSRSIAGYSVVSGLVVTQKAAGADMSVDVSEGSYILGGTYGSTSGVTNVAIDASDPSNPRLDILYVNSSGTLTIAKGTAASVIPSGESDYKQYEEPYPVDMSSTDGIILAIIHVGAGVTTITNANIWMLAAIRTLSDTENIDDLTPTTLNIPTGYTKTIFVLSGRTYTIPQNITISGDLIVQHGM